MAGLNDLIQSSGDDAKQLIKSNLLELIQSAKAETAVVVNETGEKVEKWCLLKLTGEIDAFELEALLNARKRVILQFLNTQEIAARTRLEKITIGLIDLVLDKAIDAIL